LRARTTAVPGYTFNSWMDSSLGDLVRVTTAASPASLAATCNADPACVGFNTRGYLKASIRPKE
jgi:hypothetical protein